MAISASYVNVPLGMALSTCQVTSANTNRDGTGTLGTVLTAPSTGCQGVRIEGVRIQATTTTTAGMVRLFITDGTTTRMVNEVSVSAITPSGTVAAFVSDIDTGVFPMVLPPGWSLKASTHNAESFNVIAKLAGSL